MSQSLNTLGQETQVPIEVRRHPQQFVTQAHIHRELRDSHSNDTRFDGYTLF